MRRTAFALAFTALIAAFAPAQAQDSQSSPAAPGGQSLGQAASDPTASLMSFQINDWYTAKFHGLDDETANQLVFRAVIPFSTGGFDHIFRATVPFITDHPVADSGLSDSTIFDLVVFDEDWGRWGVGAVALLPTGGEASGAEKWGLGPALGFTVRSPGLLWGVFNQNVFTVAGDDDREDVNISIFQPILSHRLGAGWSVGVSDMNLTYDWEGGRFSSLPLGAKVSKLLRLAGSPVQFSAQYEHDFADDEIGPADTFRFTIKFLVPK